MSGKDSDMENMRRIPIGRVIEKLDDFLFRGEYDDAERHLKFWIAESTAIGDEAGKLSVLNEQIGFYRKIRKEEECLRTISVALDFAREAGILMTPAMGTTLVNAATGYRAFGQTEKAISLYEEAIDIYGETLDPGDERFGGLYNNLGTALSQKNKFDEAEKYYKKALAVTEYIPGGEPDCAIICCNLADLSFRQYGAEEGEREIEKYLSMAEGYMNSDTAKQDGHYAFVCERLAETFGYYGYFIKKNEFMKRSKEIHERA